MGLDATERPVGTGRSSRGKREWGYAVTVRAGALAWRFGLYW
jgi:hypothetical protein